MAFSALCTFNNNISFSKPSKPSKSVTPVSNIALLSNTGSTITVRFTEVNTIGTITGYAAYANGIAVPSSGTSSSFVIAGLSNNTTYSITIVSNGTSGNSTPSTAVQLSTAVSYTITTFAGGGASYTNDALATSVSLNNIFGLAVDSGGNVYISDFNAGTIRKITTSTGIITTYAGTGTQNNGGTPSSGVTATSTQLSQAWGLAVDLSNTLYIADYYIGANLNRTITQTVNPTTNIITTLTPTGVYDSVHGVMIAFDNSNNYHICDSTTTSVVYKISGGTRTIVAGGGATFQNNVAATSSSLAYPNGIRFDSSNNLYIADTNNYRVRKVNASTNIITTIAGTGTNSNTGDNGYATSASLSYPTDVMIDRFNNVYVLCGTNLRKIDGSTGIITSIATGLACNGRGQLGIYNGTIYIGDAYNSRVLKLI